jgi:hypothetical protein
VDVRGGGGEYLNPCLVVEKRSLGSRIVKREGMIDHRAWNCTSSISSDDSVMLGITSGWYSGSLVRKRPKVTSARHQHSMHS